MNDAGVLRLDSDRWDRLSTRMGPGSFPIARVLSDLTADPSNLQLFRELWPELCSEGITYDAAFAATPYFVALADTSNPPERDEYLIVVGLIVTGVSTPPPSDLEAAFQSALHLAVDLTCTAVASCKRATTSAT